MSNDDSLAMYGDVSPWRRFGAFGIDYFAVILPFLGLCGFAGWASMCLEITPLHTSRPWLNQGIIILFVTAPIACYFAIGESSAWQATLGKRLMKSALVNLDGKRISLRQSFVRVAVKFLPWEYFHTILWQ